MVAAPAKSRSTEKPSIAIVGLGNCGSTLAWALHAAGFPVVEMVAHRPPTGAQKKLARDCGARLVRWKDWHSSLAEIVWICVRDDQIADVAREIAERFDSGSWAQPLDDKTVPQKRHPKVDGKNRVSKIPKVFLHTSGPRSYRELDALKRPGVAIGSAHPVRSFPSPQRASLRGAYFAIEGDAAARKAAHAMVAGMQAIPFPLHAKSKAQYHAFCVLSSPLLVAHLAAAENLGVAAGVPKGVATRLLASLASGTFANWQRSGAPASFVGPVARGDIETIGLHLASLTGMPELDAIYRALSDYAVSHLPAKKRAQLAALLATRRAGER